MTKLSGFEFFPLQMTKKGAVFDAAEKRAILDAVEATGAKRITDLFVLSHGWNNDMKEARDLYAGLLKEASKLLTGARGVSAKDRRIVVVGVFWPSKKFADEEVIPAGGAASTGSAASGGKREVTAGGLKKKLDGLKGTFDKADTKALNGAKRLVDRLEDSPAARRQFVALIRSVLPKPTDRRDDASDQFFKRSGDTILQSLSAPIAPSMPHPSGSSGGVAALKPAVGGAAGIGDLFSGIKAAAWRLLNYATFYQMKERAGIVGGGLNAVLKGIRAARPDLHIHLVGHSFGARLVTAAAAGSAKIAPRSMTLLQGAFSHNGFTEKFDGKSNGFFRNVITQARVAGPILATHTINDRAVGIAYPIAVRISGDNRLAIGDENDVYGGIGRNGAVRMKANEFKSMKLLAANGTYAFELGKVHNLEGGAFISDHGAVTGPQCANAMLAAAGL